jgi:peroxiredoxin
MQYKMWKLAAVSLLSLAAAGVQAAAVIGQPAPDFSVSNATGSTVTLSSFKGKTVVLEWTNHLCPFVQKHYDNSGNIPALQQAASADGVIWLQLISSAPGKQGHVDGATALQLNRDRKAVPTEVLLDESGQVGKLYEAQTTPHLYVVNADGVLVYKGGIDSIKSSKAEDIAKAQPYLKDALAAVKAGQPVKNAATAPYGCSIKYAD